MLRTVLGISADYHDAAAAVVVDGTVVAAALEERFSRTKHDPRLPRQAIAWCLEAAEVEPGGLDLVAFYSKPITTYERILSTHATVGPRGIRSLLPAVSSWTGRKLWISYRIDRALRALGHGRVPLRYVEHHQSHAAAAFLPSPFEEAAILTFDGVGEWTTTSIALGRGHAISMLEQQRFPHSLGLFYSAMTAFCGFEVNDGELKLMGLAPYGEPRYADVLLERVVRIQPEGNVWLDQRWFDYRTGRRMTHPRIAELLDGGSRRSGDPLEQRHADIAASAQLVLEEAILAIANRAHELTGMRRACLAGGVALNCVANERLLRDGPFDEVWVQPAAGDDGSALGAALWTWHQLEGMPRRAASPDGMNGAFLGPSYTQADVTAMLDERGISYTVPATENEQVDEVAAALDEGQLVGWFTGAMEFGPRALGHRSILADPRDRTVVDRLNRAVKGREGFRPFAPSVLAEYAEEWFDVDGPRPYMLFTASVRKEHLLPEPDVEPASLEERLAVARSTIPACTHVDLSARVQTVDRATNPRFHALLSAFHERTGVPVLVNTSFNRADEPIVCTPADALRCFDAAGLDLLVLEGCLVRRSEAVDP